MIDRPAIDGAAVWRRLAWLVRAAPGAFRDDPVFRYTALGAALALLTALSNLGRQGVSVPAAPPLPATLGASYADRGGATASIASASVPIAPSRPASGLTITRDPRGQPDRFGTLRAAQQPKTQSRQETP